jgi:3-oxoacyl-[acyl-carrier-protein] synthase II
MKGMQISGIGVTGGFGSGTRELLAALEQGRVEPALSPATEQGRLPVYRAPTTALERYLNKRVLRRIDHFSRLALLGAFQALEDAEKRFDVVPDRSRLGLVLCSGFGALNTTFKFLDSVIDDGDPFASPTAFSNSVHNAAAAHISMQLGITGPGQTLSQFDHSFVAGVQQAQLWLDEGRVDAVLMGVVDEYSSVLGYCCERLLGVDASTRMRPFADDTTSALPGEGAAFFLLNPYSSGMRGHARITAAQSGNLRGNVPHLQPSTPLILGCEGHPLTAGMYQKHIPAHMDVACYTPLYGASPVAPGFDAAIAALSLERGEMFTSTGMESGVALPWNPIGDAIEVNALACVDFGAGGEFSVIHLQR